MPSGFYAICPESTKPSGSYDLGPESPTPTSSGYTDSTKADKRIGQKRRQKTVARLLCGHMFLLCGAGPYVSIGWLWAWGSAICFYYAALGHMFVLAGCGRGAGPYVSIMWR